MALGCCHSLDGTATSDYWRIGCYCSSGSVVVAVAVASGDGDDGVDDVDGSGSCVRGSAADGNAFRLPIRRSGSFRYRLPSASYRPKVMTKTPDVVLACSHLALLRD